MSTLLLIKDGHAVTMSSIELVQVINDLREAGKAELRHDNFMAKVEKVLGAMSPKFLGVIERPMPNGGTKEIPCYYLPKREASLMVMSESYSVQAKVYDRMTELEAGAADPLASLPPEHRALVALMVDNAKIKARQDEQAATQAAQGESIKRIEANQVAAVGSVTSFTALGYSIFREIPMSKIELTRLGRKAAALSKARGITIDHVSDGRFGRVGSYHVIVLDDALEEISK